jgi:hypothetical protein
MSATQALNEYTLQNTRVDTWNERDRCYAILYSGDQTLMEYWDDDLCEIIADGFIDPRNWHESMLAYYKHLNS